MSVPRGSALGATRVCPHCKAVVLQSASICPGCKHHLRFNIGAAEPQSESVSAMRIEGTINHAARDESCEYCVVVSITNERGEKIARQVVGVGALQPGEKHNYSFSVDLMPIRAVVPTRDPAPPRGPVPPRGTGPGGANSPGGSTGPGGGIPPGVGVPAHRRR